MGKQFVHRLSRSSATKVNKNLQTSGFAPIVEPLRATNPQQNQETKSAKSLDLKNISVLAPGRSISTPIQAQGILGQTQPHSIQRKSDKLPQKNDLLQQAKAGYKLSKTSYTKVLDAIHEYHTKVNANNYIAQLLKLVDIYNLIVEWEIDHNRADSNVNSKNAKEASRRQVLSTLKTTNVPQEIGDVYQQAKNAGNTPDVVILQQLMDATALQSTVKGVIERDYATALRGYNATNQQIGKARTELTGKKRQFMKGGGIDVPELEKAYGKGKNLSTDELGGGYYSEETLAEEIDDDNDTKLMKALKKEYQLIKGTKQGVNQMSDIEYMSLAAYTGSGYTAMNDEMRGLIPGMSGANKNQRTDHVKKKKEIQQSILMATSAMNKLPDWNGSTVYRGEDISGRENQFVQGATIVMSAFTSTTTDIRTATNFARGSAVWKISGVTASGKAVSKISLSQASGNSEIQELVMGDKGQAKEDEVLLKPYTKLYIDQIITNPPNLSCKYLIEAHEV